MNLQPPQETDVKAICLLAVMNELDTASEASDKQLITLRMLANMLNWFGPYEGSQLLDNVAELLSKPWFHGKISGKEAEAIISAQPVGTFLFRFSTSDPGSYAITVHTRHAGVKHFRIYHQPGGNYIMGKAENSSLYQVLLRFKGELGLKKECPGSKFLAVFKQDRFLRDRYNEWEDDGEL